MHQKAKSFLTIFSFFLNMIGCVSLIMPSPAQAEENQKSQSCAVHNRDCLLDKMITLAADIDNKAWKDQTFREIAKTLAFDGKFEQAVSLIDKIETPDTKAMTIRGIGMMLATHNYSAEELNNKFATLHGKANEINHAASHSIALTYIAMAQAFAGDDVGAWKTCAIMENIALQNKAYGETAEIQAERGDFKAAQKSIQSIKSSAYQNKAYETISRLLSEKSLYEDALSAASAITNPYKKTQALQYMLDKQKPRERLKE
jgi:hypothetical protein